MRILLQDGMIDAPYETVAVNIWNKIDNRFGRNAFCVYMHSISINAKEVVMAKYSSYEKALKAMQMLREVNENLENTTKYFVFPADDEIEV